MPKGAKLLGAKGFGERLYWARLQKGADERRQLNQTEVGRAVGVTQTTVARWERGEKEPSLERIEAVAAYFGILPCWLAFGAGELRAAPGTSAAPRVGPPVSDHAQPMGRAAGRGRRRGEA
jgi:transcriptional regulator with XRE-family HTH domain